MNLYHFKQEVSSVIINRGFADYEMGYVSDFVHEEKGDTVPLLKVPIYI